MENVLEFYRRVLAFGSMVADQKGLISSKKYLNDETDPMTINGKRLVLPMQEFLRNSEGYAIFHPGREVVQKGESEVVEMLRKKIITRLNFVLGTVILKLITFANSPTMQRNMTAEQQQFIADLDGCDEKIFHTFNNILMKGAQQDSSSTFIRGYWKRGGTIGDKKYSRAFIVNFPVLDEVNKGTTNIYGQTLRAKDAGIIKKLFEYVLPNSSDMNAYTRGSNCFLAPNLDSMLASMTEIAGCINIVLDRFTEHLSADYQHLYSEDTLFEYVGNLESLRNELQVVPFQALSDGKSMVASNTAAVAPTVEPTQNMVQTQPQPPFQQPQVIQQQQPVNPLQQSAIVPQGGPKLDLTNAQVHPLQNPITQTLYGPQVIQQAMQPMMMAQQPQQPQWAAPQVQTINTPMGPANVVQTPQGLMQLIQTPQGIQQIPFNPNMMQQPMMQPMMQQQPMMQPMMQPIGAVGVMGMTNQPQWR